MSQTAKKPKQKEINYKKRMSKLQSLSFAAELDYELRAEQEKALEWVKKPLSQGKKFMILEMPTGTGKSIWSQYFIDYYLKEINPKARFDILTNTKILQQQYTDEFYYMNNLSGRNAYTCEKHNNNCEYGKTCNTNNNSKCEECPYVEAFNSWKDGQISITNFHIHGIFSLFNQKILDDRNSNVLIVDEAHLLEETVNNFISFTLSKKVWKNYVSATTAAKWENEVFDFKDIDDVVKWIEDIFKMGLKNAIANKYNKMSKMATKQKEKEAKIITEMERLQVTINKFIADYKEHSTEWVADKRNDKGTLVWEIKPLWTSHIMEESVWSNYTHVVLMSGTIIDPHTFCHLNGIEPSRASFLRMDTPFDLKNRPIYYLPCGKLTYNNKESAWEQFKPTIRKILDKYSDKKGIIHTGNYEIWQWIKRDFDDDERLIFASPTDRDICLRQHLESDKSTVLVSPSMMQGIDLKDDYSRFQVLVKIPYPSLASKVNKQRMKTKPQWYSWRTILDMIQSYGRSIRSKEDYADTIILDSCFSDVIAMNSKIIPKYFLDAIKKKK
jgi:ATP-dependent DNA helicase DinG